MPKPPSKKVQKEEQSVPYGLKVYKFHHINSLEWSDTDDDAEADCPFCGREGKFGIDKNTGVANCFVCGTSTNPHSFVRKLWEMSLEETTDKNYEELARDSNFLFSGTAKEWGVARHLLTDEWCVPGYNHEKKVTGLYRYARIKNKKGKWVTRLLASPDLGHHLFGLNLYDKRKTNIYLCEGWRDAIVLYETLKHTELMLDDVNVLAVPGTNSWKLTWSELFRGKKVSILYDNDYPKEEEKGERLIGGPSGVRRVSSHLVLTDGHAEINPEVEKSVVPLDDIRFLAWGGSKDAYNTDLPDGLDLRDYLTQDD